MMDKSRYEHLKEIVHKITKSDSDCNDLFHDVLQQLLKNEKFITMPEKQQNYFFVRTIMNQFFSNNSHFFKTYRKFQAVEFQEREMIDTNYDEIPTLDWIYETLDIELMDNPNNWYNVGLYKLYLEDKKISKLHIRTKIPKHSIRYTIKVMNSFINQKWIDYKKKENGTN